MTWAAHHHRDDVLRAVLAEAASRRDGVLPAHLPGVAETFEDETELVGALGLRWHTRLAGAIERELMEQPMDLEAAVVAAWRRADADLPGVHPILEHYADEPVDESMATALSRSRRKDWTLMAAMAGQASIADRSAEHAGRAIEERAAAA